MIVNFLSFSALEDEGYAVMFQDGQILVWIERDTLDVAMRLGII